MGWRRSRPFVSEAVRESGPPPTADSAAGGKESVGNPDDLNHLCHVVDANDVCAIQNARSDGCGGSPDSLFRRRWLSVAGKGGAKKAFARSAHQHRIAEGGEPRQAPQQLAVLLEAFPETNSRIEHDLRSGDSRSERLPGGSAQSAHHVTQYIARKGFLLHRSGLSAHVHEDQRRAMLRGNVSNPWVVAQA